MEKFIDNDKPDLSKEKVTDEIETYRANLDEIEKSFGIHEVSLQEFYEMFGINDDNPNMRRFIDEDDFKKE